MLDLFVKISFIICSWILSVLISHNWCGPLLWATDANPCVSVIYILLVLTQIIMDPCIFVSIVYSHLDCSCRGLCHCQWRHNPTVLSPYYCHPIGCFLLLRFRQSSCVLDCIHCDLGCGCHHIHCGCNSLVILSPSSTKFRESLRHSYLWVSVIFLKTVSCLSNHLLTWLVVFKDWISLPTLWSVFFVRADVTVGLPWMSNLCCGIIPTSICIVRYGALEFI
jgi:hypothetical protein